jgi:uncharacterized membrane protein YdjX (TVP38/TMEM64 family)
MYLSTIAFAVAILYTAVHVVFPDGFASVPECSTVWDEAIRNKSGNPNSIRVQLVWVCMRSEQVRGTSSMLLFGIAWVFLKALALPGSMIFCIALGGMLSPVQAQIFGTVCELLGGSACFALSGVFGRVLLERFVPSLLKRVSGEVQEMAQQSYSQLFWYSLFMRMTPLVPNWFVNAASPVVGIPFPIFVVTTVLGSQAAILLGIGTGAVLKSMGDEAILAGANNAVDDPNAQLRNVGILFGLQFFSLGPVLWQRRQRRKGVVADTAAAIRPAQQKKIE